MATETTAAKDPKDVVAIDKHDIANFPFPILIGIPEEMPEGSLVSYCLCEDGMYLMKRIMGDGHVTTKVNGLMGAPKGKEMIFALPRLIPISAFFATAKFFRYVEEHFKKTSLEAYVLVAYRPEKDEYFMYVPKQRVAGASVSYDISDFHKDHPDSVVVLDIHSHTSSMSAFFSGTDDNDDHRDRYSMVLGKINKLIPEYKIRFCSGGKRTEIGLDDLFIDNDELVTIDNAEAIKNVTTTTYTYGGANTGKSSYTGGGQRNQGYGSEYGVGAAHGSHSRNNSDIYADAGYDDYHAIGSTHAGSKHTTAEGDVEVILYGADGKPILTQSTIEESRSNGADAKKTDSAKEAEKTSPQSSSVSSNVVRLNVLREEEEKGATKSGKKTAMIEDPSASIDKPIWFDTLKIRLREKKFTLHEMTGEA